MNAILLRSRRACAALVLLLLAWSSPAWAGLIQMAPWSYLDDIFMQPSIRAANGGNGIAIHFAAPQTLYAHSTIVGGSGVSLAGLTEASGLKHSLSIPLFYVDGFAGSSAVGLGWLDDNGIAVLTSLQETLQLRPAGRDYSCSVFPGCFYNIPAITEADVLLGWWRSAAVLAHEIAHNLGLGHTATGLMAPAVAPLHESDQLSAYLLGDLQVMRLLDSPFVQSGLSGYRYIDIVPFNVLLAAVEPPQGVPEPVSLLLAVLALGLLAGARRRPTESALSPARG